VTGVSYRQASESMERLLGYPVISHEAIRQQLLNTEVVPKKSAPLEQDVVFVEVDGLYTKSQGKKKKGREIKIASVHQGWEMNGKRAKLIDKRHFIHQGKWPFWKEFEQYLMQTYEYDPTKHHLVIMEMGRSGSPPAVNTLGITPSLSLTAFTLPETFNACLENIRDTELFVRNSQAMIGEASWWN